MKSRVRGQVVEIVDIVSSKFASDEAAGWKVDVLEPLFYSQQLAMPDLSVEASLPEKIYTTVVLLELRLLSRYKPGKKYALNKQYALLSQLHLLTCVYGIPISEAILFAYKAEHFLYRKYLQILLFWRFR